VALYRNARDRDDAQAMLSRRLGRILPVEVG
jgi:hypothetical protein